MSKNRALILKISFEKLAMVAKKASFLFVLFCFFGFLASRDPPHSPRKEKRKKKEERKRKKKKGSEGETEEEFLEKGDLGEIFLYLL